MLKVGVVGLGNWGTALANHLANKGYDVLGWEKNPQVVESINANHVNAIYQKDVVLCKNLKATSNISDLKDSDMILLVVPSFALNSVIPQLPINDDMLIVSAIKGLERNSLKTPIDYVLSTFNNVNNLMKKRKNCFRN